MNQTQREEILKYFDAEFPDYSDLPNTIYKPAPDEIIVRQGIKSFLIKSIDSAYTAGVKDGIQQALTAFQNQGLNTERLEEIFAPLFNNPQDE